MPHPLPLAAVAASQRRLIEARITARLQEAEATISLYLMAAHGGELPAFEAGAHIDLHLPKGLVRSYSLCSDPAQRQHYRLGVLLEERSRGGSRSVHQDLKVGDPVWITEPRNHFPLDEDTSHTILLAGGIGVTPLLAMARRLHTLGRSFEFHYATRSIARTAFRQELIESPFAARVQLYVDDGPPGDRLSVDSILRDPARGSHVYVCGPTGFIDYATAAAQRHGWHSNQIHLEYFGAELVTHGAPFTVICARSGISVVVGPDDTIAGALTAAGIEVNMACQEGICGTCVTPVLAGIPDHRDLFLDLEVKAENSCLMLCCSRAKTPTITLDI